MQIVRNQRSYDEKMSLQFTVNSHSPLQDWWETQAEFSVQIQGTVRATSFLHVHF